MKKITVILTLALLTTFSIDSIAQLSRKERKEWKRKAKEYVRNPEQMKQLIEDSEAQDGQLSSLRAENKALKSRMSDKDAKISELQDDLSKLRRDLSAAKAEVREMKTAPTEKAANNEMVNGVVFKVQIGAFRNKDLSKYFENNENFGGENGNDMQKITLGQFRDYWEADTFKKYLREMGVKDAWIVPYKNGNRVPIKEVLEGVIADAPADSK